MDKYSNTLTHHGILGMRWGHSKGSGESSSGRRLSKKEIRANSEKNRRKAIKSMSSEELTARIARIELEQKLTKLTTPSKAKSQKAKEFVSKVLLDVGDKMAKQLVSSASAKAINSALGQEVVFANNKKK